MNVEIAQRLAARRKQAGLSQEALAERLGVSRQAVSKWERSESSPDTDNLIALAQLYGLSLDDLLYVDDEIRDDVIVRGGLPRRRTAGCREGRIGRAPGAVHIGHAGKRCGWRYGRRRRRGLAGRRGCGVRRRSRRGRARFRERGRSVRWGRR